MTQHGMQTRFVFDAKCSVAGWDEWVLNERRLILQRAPHLCAAAACVPDTKNKTPAPAPPRKKNSRRFFASFKTGTAAAASSSAVADDLVRHDRVDLVHLRRVTSKCCWRNIRWGLVAVAFSPRRAVKSARGETHTHTISTKTTNLGREGAQLDVGRVADVARVALLPLLRDRALAVGVHEQVERAFWFFGFLVFA